MLLHPRPGDDACKEETLAGVAVGAGAVAAAIGLFHLVSWLVRFGRISYLSPEISSCLLFSGTALAMASAPFPRKALRWPAGILAGLAAAVALLSFLLGPDRGFHPPGLPSLPATHGMGGTDAVGLALAGTAIILLLRLKPPVLLVQAIAIMLSMVSLSALLGHLYQVEATPPSGLVRSALPTTISTLVIGIGLLFSRPRDALMAPFTAITPGGSVARRLVVPAVVLPVLFGWLRLQGELHGLYGLVTGTSLLVLSWIAVLLSLAHQVAIRTDAERKASEEHLAKEAMREGERRLHEIVDHLTEGLIVADPESGALQWNRKALGMFEYPEQSRDISFMAPLVDTYELTTLEGEVLPVEQWPVQRILRGEELHDLELSVTDRKRDWQRIYSYSGVLIRDDRKRPKMGLLTVKDVTSRKLAENALRESEEKFRAVFQQAAVGMGRVSFSDARWMQVNDAFCRMLGYTDEEMRSTPWPEMTHPEDLELDLIPFRQMASGQLEDYTVEKRFFHREGHIVWARLTLSLVRDAHGQPDYEIAIIEDITLRKEAEEALRKAKDQLEQRVRERTAELRRAYQDLQRETEKRLSAVEDLRTKEQLLVQQSRLAAMGEMLGNIAHQWRQPLNVLALLVQQLDLSYQAGQFTGETLKAEVAKALKLIKHMSQTIDDFKDFLREEKEHRVFSVNNAVVTTVSLLEPELKKMNIELSINQAAEVLVTGHRNEFSHVVMNLITNSRDAFAERGTAAPRIVIGIFKEEAKSVVTIADNAGGIPEEFRDRIFEPYFTTKGPDKGTGIGLFMSKSIIEKSMGGKLSVRNLQEGAEFRIEL